MMKRAFDVVVAAAVLAVLWPVMLIVAVAILVDSGTPVLFRQDRVGLTGQVFRIRKFRTLRNGPQGALVSPTDDPRITRVGAVLRRTKLDELPQLIDVVEGRMSLVGPRPEVPRYVALWPDDLRDVILSVRPGITDPASVAFRHEPQLLASAADPERYYVEVLLPEKARMYAEYVRTQSLAGDVRVIADTVLALVGRAGASSADR
jgi:lipopolysaccharide/colanic/teichoic acid biosynthesis glycosyltransferase